MSNTSRVDKELFESDHYLGKPADDTDLIISRRIQLMEAQPGFFDKDKDCIEIGCGGGATINRVAKKFRQCLGIDIFNYTEPFKEQQKKWDAHNSAFRVVNLEQDVFTEKFQRIISFEVIEHFQNEDTVSKYFDILESGGLAAISVPNKWWIFETHGAHLPLLPWNRVPFFSWLPRPLHERWANARIYTKSRIIKLLKKQGFEIITCEYVSAPMDVLKEGKLKRWLLRNIFNSNSTKIPFLATAIFVLAKKPSPKG